MNFNNLKLFLIGLPLLAALLLGHFVFVNSLFYDEINPLAFVYNTAHSSDIFQVIRELFAYHNEHVLFFVKLVFLIDYFFHNSVDLKEIIYFGTLLFTLFLFQLYKYLKLTINETVLLSLLVFLPMFWDIYLNPLSIQNVFVLIFVIASLQKLKENKLPLSAFLMICSFLSSAQGLLLLPIWLFFAYRKKASILELIIPTLFALFVYFHKPSGNLAITTSPLIEFSNHQKMKLLWTYLSPPFNKSFFLVQLSSFIFLLVISFNFIKTALKEKLNFKSENYNEVTIGLIIWCIGCLLSSFFLRQVMENRYFLYAALIFYILLILFLRKHSIIAHRFISLLIFISFLHFIFNLYDAIVPLKNLYMERRFNYFNFKSNYMANFFPTDEVRKRAEDIQNGKIDLFKEQVFNIPSGINGSESNHLKVFNEFVPISLRLIKFDENKDFKLIIKNIHIKNSFTLKNDRFEGLKKLIRIKVPGKSIFDVFYLQMKIKNTSYFFQLKEDSNHFHSAEIYSNQLPYGKFELSFIKGTLAKNPSHTL